jgi:hypothetical protein
VVEGATAGDQDQLRHGRGIEDPIERDVVDVIERRAGHDGAWLCAVRLLICGERSRRRES